jgi:hypothetical protein
MLGLRGDGNAGRSKYGRPRRDDRCRRFRPNSSGHFICRSQNWTCIRKSVKATAPADAITRVRRNRHLMVGKRLLERRRGAQERSIAQITVGRVNCQTSQHRAQQPCDAVTPRCDGTIHVPNDKSPPARSPAAPLGAQENAVEVLKETRHEEGQQFSAEFEAGDASSPLRIRR